MVDGGESTPHRGPSRRGLIARYVLFVSGLILALVVLALTRPGVVVASLLFTAALVTAALIVRRKNRAQSR
jgi:Flp pilus assembly protein TadB